MALREFSGHIVTKKNLSEHMLEIRFNRPADFMYSAGQYVQLVIPESSGKETTRSYSLSSTPACDYLEFAVKLYENGLGSEFLKSKSIGDTLIFRGPLGQFINNQTVPVVGIATGAGMVPVFSIIEDELKNKKNESSVDMLFGARTESDLFWLDRLNDLKKEFSNFSFMVTLSQPESGWNGKCGRVTEYLNAVSPAAHFFLCGNTEMVKDASALLTNQGVPVAHIHREIF